MKYSNGTIEVIPDPKKAIQFWLDALAQPNLEESTIKLLNQGLRIEIQKYIMPVFTLQESNEEKQDF